MCFFYICLHSYYFQCFSFLLRNQRSAHFFCKRPKSLYLRLCGNWILVLPVLEWCCVAHNISRPCFLPCDGQWSLSSLAAAAAKLLQPCPTLCDPIEDSPPGSPVPGILQARTLELVTISFSNAWKWKVKGKSLSRVQLFTTPWTAAYEAPLSMRFSRQEYWSRGPWNVAQPWKTVK